LPKNALISINIIHLLYYSDVFDVGMFV
jgi:hypothetical protein